MGRPTKCTPEVTKAYCEAVDLWCTDGEAARYIGVDESTIYRWQSRGKRAKRGVYHDFATAIARARVRRDLRTKGEIYARGTRGRRTTYYRADGTTVARVVDDPPDYRALTWLLKHDQPELYDSKSPLFILRHLQRLAGRADGANRESWQHLADVVARSMARLRPFGAAAEVPEDEVDEVELGADLAQAGMDPADVMDALKLLRRIRTYEPPKGLAPGSTPESDNGKPAVGSDGHA